MASPNPPPQTPTPAAMPPTTTTTGEQPPAYDPVIHNVALGVTPIALGALFLPPRRLDLRQVFLGGVAVWGTNRLVTDYSGRSFAQRFAQRMAALSGTELPEKAQQKQAQLRAERARRQWQQDAEAARRSGLPSPPPPDQQQQQEDKNKKGERGALEAIWMGDQGDDWREQRDRREAEALREGGGGYWGLITDQISEVWNQGRKKELEAQAAEIKAKADANEGKKP